MTAIAQVIFSYAFPWSKSFVFFIQISLKFAFKDPVDNNPSLVQPRAE